MAHTTSTQTPATQIIDECRPAHTTPGYDAEELMALQEMTMDQLENILVALEHEPYTTDTATMAMQVRDEMDAR